MCEPAEPSYFVDPRDLTRIYPDMLRRKLWRSEERYLELFSPAGDARVLGEASTSYTKRPLVPGVVERIAAFNPDARFIYLLRDPVERAVSHYWHMVRHHTGNSGRSPMRSGAMYAIRRVQPLRDAAQALPGALRPRPDRGGDLRTPHRRSGGRDARRI